MSNIMNFEIVTQEKTVLKEEILQVTVPTKTGEITVLANHVPLVSTIISGVIQIKKKNEKTEIISISGGFIEVLKDKVVILANTAERAEDIDIERAEDAKKRAEEMMKDTKRFDKARFTNINAQIAKELARTKAAKRWKKIKNINS